MIDPRVAELVEGVGAVVQRTIIDGELPALVVVYDEDSDWLIGDGINDPNVPDACGLYHLSHVLNLDETVVDAVMTLAQQPGHVANRDTADDPWVIEPWEYER